MTQFSTPIYAIIVAGGNGTRMSSAIPKQFISLCGKPILQHTIEVFQRWNKAVQIILVLPQEQIALWQSLYVVKDIDTSTITTVEGGSTRFESVKNGLNHIPEMEGIVAIHDGVRPLVTTAIIEESYRIAMLKGNAVAAVPLKDSIRKISEENNLAVDRAAYQLVQTPQTFLVSQIKSAYEKADGLKETFTDDASVAEGIGQKINLISGSYENIKITTPEDLLIAEAIFKNRTISDGID